jgi:gamma-glutamyltranspeptidase/glutathione hydrolase
MSRPPCRLPIARAMIVAPQPEAAEAGGAVLASGGSALDALLACAFTQGVVDPLMCGIGGLGVLQLHDPRSGETTVLDGLSTCPGACTPTMWEAAYQRDAADGYGYILANRANEIGHSAVTTPGILRLFALAHARWGRLAWESLFGPAIDFAESGWIIRPHVHTMMTANEAAYGRLDFTQKLALTTEGAALYLRPDGTPKRPGEAVRNPALAATLRDLARDGVESFYTGPLAGRIVAEMQAHGGLLSAADLAGFRVSESAPLLIPYRGYTVSLPAPPSGGIVIAQMLRILAQFDLVGMGHNSPAYIRTLAAAMRIALADREAHIGDPALQPPPLDWLLGDPYVAECAARIRAGTALPMPALTATAKDTTTISCIDADGMVASLTHTLGVPSGVIVPGTGFMLNGAMNWYDPRPGRAGSIAPGKKRFSSMAPTIVFHEGRPVATLGAPGGAWIGIALLQTLVNMLDFGMGMQEAVQAPRFAATGPAIDISNRIPRAVECALVAQGETVRRAFHSYPFAAPHGISRWDGALEGGADPQRDGMAVGIG